MNTSDKTKFSKLYCTNPTTHHHGSIKTAMVLLLAVFIGTLLASFAWAGELGSQNISMLLADIERPYIYALVNDSAGPDSLLVIDANNETYVARLPLTDNPTDMDINYYQSELYIIGMDNFEIDVIDLNTLTHSNSFEFPAPADHSQGQHYHVVAGRPGRLYYTDAAWAPNIHVLDTFTGVHLGMYSFNGVGDLNISPDKNTLYAWRQYGWGAGIMNSWVSRISCTTDNLSLLQTSNTGLSRDPRDTPMLVTRNGDFLVCKERSFESGDISLHQNEFPDDIYAMTQDGLIVFTSSEVYNSTNTESIYTLPFSTSIMAVAGNQEKLFLHHPNTGNLTVIAMEDIGILPEVGANPVPADGLTFASPVDSLSWDMDPLAISYQVYLGTDAATVAAADPSSPEYQGQVSSNSLILDHSPDPGGIYFWRVDLVGFSQTISGQVWSFTLAPVTISPSVLKLHTVTGLAPFQVELDMQFEGPMEDWTVKENIPWLEVNSSFGSVPSPTLTMTVNVDGVDVGYYQELLTFTWGEYVFDVPLEMDLQNVAPTKFLADQERPFIYAIDPGNGISNGARLHFLSTETGQMVKSIPIGWNPTDLAINYGEGKLYVTNWGQPETRVVDLATQEELPSLNLGADVFKVNAGRPGRIYCEEEDQWIDIKIIDSNSGQEMGSMFVREGDGEIDPTGNYYFHCGNNSSGARIQKFDISTDSPMEVAASLVHGYGSRNLVMSPDGTRLFWKGGYIYDADLNELGQLGGEIHATTLHGDLAMSSSAVYNVHTGDVIYNLPGNSNVMAVAGDQANFFYFDETAGRIEVIPMAEIADIPGPGLNPQPADRADVILPLDSLVWDLDPIAMGYQVYFGTDSAAVGTAGPNDPEYLGEVTESFIPLDADLQFEQTYYWRIDTVGFSQTEPGSVWSFRVAPFVIDPKVLDLKVVLNSTPEIVQLRVETNGPFDLLRFKEDIPWLSINEDLGPNAPDYFYLTLDVAGMSAGQYTDVIHFSWESYAVPVPVHLELFEMELSKMLADQERPWIYGLHPGSGNTDDSFLVFINTETDNAERCIPIGSNATDLTINYGEGKLYVSNWLRQNTRVVDLATQEELAPLDMGRDVYKLNAGRPGRIYYEEEDQWINIHIIDSETGEDLGSWHVREGDGEIDPTGNYYFHCGNNSSGAKIQKFDISTDSPVEVAGSLVHGYGSRNLIMSPDGSRLFWKGGYVYDADLNELGHLSSEIYATTLHGDLAMSASSVFNVHTGEVIYNLPVSTSVMAVSGDQQKLYLFDDGIFNVVAMEEIADIPSPGLNPGPVDRSTVILPVENFSWDIDPVAIGYQVFFGADSTAVANADIESPEYLDQVTSNEIPPGEILELGSTYFWRIDVVGFTGTTPGQVWSFTVFPLSVDPSALDLTMVTGLASFSVEFELGVESLPGVSDWTINEDIPWVSLNIQSGTGPATVEVSFDLEALNPGQHSDEITLAAGNYQATFPVALDLIQMDISKVLADLERPYIYGLHRGSGDFESSFLLFINTETEIVEKVIPIGSNATDLSISYGEGKLYVSNWLRQNTRVVDLTTQVELAPLDIGNDVYKINAGRPGRIYYEEEDQWVYIHIIDSDTGEDLGTWHVREGDGEIDPTGNYYFHCGNNSTGANIQKFDISTDSPVEVAESLVHGYGSRNLIMSSDGCRLFWKGGYIYDADLNELGHLGSEIYATTMHGDLAFSESSVFNVHTGQEIYNLPVISRVLAVSGDQTKVFIYDDGAGEFQVVPMSEIAEVPGTGMNPEPADGSTVLNQVTALSWRFVPSAMSYQVYSGADSTAVANATLESPEYLGQVLLPSFDLASSLELGSTVYWRCDVVGFSGIILGPVWSFNVFPVSLSSASAYLDA